MSGRTTGCSRPPRTIAYATDTGPGPGSDADGFVGGGPIVPVFGPSSAGGGGAGREHGEVVLERYSGKGGRMALEMRERCERCGTALRHDEAARICSYECTFCVPCGAAMGDTCPNCGGELVPRPRRSAPA
jgi:hypothetical protein